MKKNSKTIKNFLLSFSSKSTVTAYKWGLKQFFQSVYGKGKLEEQAEKYSEEKKDKINEIKTDIETFFPEIKNRPPKSIQSILASIRSFLQYLEIDLPTYFWKTLRGKIKGTRAITIDKIPSNAELKKILSHMSTLGKALFSVLASSGMRIGETLKLELEDINLETDPAEITIRGEYTKSGNWRYAFISKEAKGFLEEWLKERDNYLETAIKKSTQYPKSLEDNRIFPFLHPTAYSVWNNAVKKAGYSGRDKNTNRHKLHPHVLRKFFRTKMGSVIPIDIVEALIGHEGYLTEVYRRYSKEQLAEFYKEGEYSVTIFSEAEQVGELRKEVTEQKENLQRIVNGLTAENIELKQGFKRLEKEQKQEKETLKKQVEELRDQIGLLAKQLAELQTKTLSK